MQDGAAELLTQPGSIELLAIAYFVLQLCGIVAAVHAIFNARSAQGSTAWAIALISAPLFAFPLYLIFGRNKFRGYVDARRTAENKHKWITEKARNVCDDFRSSLDDQGGRFLSLERLANLPFTYGNDIKLLIDGRPAFDAMFAAITAAEHYVLVQFFIVREDALGQQLKQLLIDKAMRGVRVFFLYDDLGTRGLSKKFFAELRNAGVRIEVFRSSRGYTSAFQVNFRNHRKIVVTDGELAFVGGLNVGEEYLGASDRFDHWRDTVVSMEGPSADAVQLIFAEDWHWATGETIDELDWETKESKGGNADVLILPSGPSDDFETCSLMFVHAIHAARERFWIASPYFVPNSEVISALQLAGLRGVDVRILLPGDPDHFMVYLASFYYMKLAGREGVKFFRYQNGFMHQKVFLVDSLAAGVGTANLDNRSFRLNFEITMLAINDEFASEVEAMLQADFANSIQVDYDEIDQKGVFFKSGAAAARLLSPIL